MASLPNDALMDLWNAVRPGLPFNAEFAIPTYWANDPYRFGSPIGPERDYPGGGTVQMFAIMPLRWDGERVVEGG